MSMRNGKEGQKQDRYSKAHGICECAAYDNKQWQRERCLQLHVVMGIPIL